MEKGKRRKSPGHWNLNKAPIMTYLTSEERKELLHRTIADMSEEDLEKMKIILEAAVASYRRDRVGSVSQKIVTGEV